MKVWMNGEFIDLDKANVNIFSHSFGRGSAVFEVFDIVSTKNGPAFFGLNQHIDRLFKSAELVYMDLPLNRDDIITACIDTAKENNVSVGAAKLFAYYSGIEFTAVPQNPQVDIAIFCIDYNVFGIKQEDLSAPVDVGVSSYKKYHPDTVPIHAKVTGNYVNPYLAMMEMKKKGYEDVIIIDVFGNVAEGATSSFFIVKDGKIKTSTLDNVLNGITRLAVIDVVTDMDMQIEEANIKAEELDNMDEAFYSVSLEHIKPIKSIDGKKLGSTCPGPYTQKVIEGMNDLYSGISEMATNWLIYINE